MRHLWINDIKDFQDIADKWDEAVMASGDFNPFLLSDFIITWWKYYHNDSILSIFVIYDDNKIAGGIPLFIKKESLAHGFARVLRYIGADAASYTDPLYAASEVKILPLLIEALNKRKDWDALHLTDVRAENRLMTEYNDRPLNHKFIFCVLQDHMDWAVDLSAGKDDYIATISKKLKKDLRAKRKHAIKDYGELRLVGIKGKEEVERYFDLYNKFSSQSFNSRYRRSTFESPEYSAFFKEFLAIMDKKSRLDAHVLFAGEKVLAISFAYKFGKEFNWVLTGFNYEYKYVRPGYLLIEELINEIDRRGQTYYNWYGHARFYKGQWCNRTTPLFQFFLVRPTSRGLYYETLKKTKSILKSNSVFMVLVNKTRRFIGKLR